MALFKAVVVCALIFLTKLRFLPGVSIAIVNSKQLQRAVADEKHLIDFYNRSVYQISC